MKKFPFLISPSFWNSPTINFNDMLGNSSLSCLIGLDDIYFWFL